MDAEARWFYSVGLAALLMGFFGLTLRLIGANVPPLWAWGILLLIVAGVVLVVFGQRRLLSRYRAWRASRPKPWPAGWKMEKRD
jgi:hypothetical protein